MSLLRVNQIIPYDAPSVSIDSEINVSGSISATTYYGDGSNLMGISGGSGSSGTSGTDGTSGSSGSSGSSGTSGGGGVTEVTYLELVSLITGETLTTGSYYLITDFQTCYDQPDYDVNRNSVASGNYKQGPIEPIIVFAISNKEISNKAYSTLYPNDKLKYDWMWNLTEITQNLALGRITERIDEYNNRTDYDHRNILFKRYKTYYYDMDEPLIGKILYLCGTTVVGLYTQFTSDLSVNDVIYIDNEFFYKVVEIISNTEMVITGNTINTFYGERYFYLAEPQVDGEVSNIPYTHTQMTDPPVDRYGEASIENFIMDGAVESGDAYFNIGSSYFTNLYPGMFILVADNINIGSFTIEGDNGADGSGSVDEYVYSTTVGSNSYSAYVKRVYDAGDPSINQIMIVNTDGAGIIHNYSTDTNNSFQEISGIKNASQIHYMIISKNDSQKIDDSDINLIVDAYVNLVDGNDINGILSITNSSYSAITSLVTNIFLFNDVENDPSSIDDGGGDMFDGGNYIYSNLTTKYKSYNWYDSNIPNDEYREFPTFRFEEELEIDGSVKSINNYVGNHSNFWNSNLSTSDFLLANNTFGLYSYSNKLGDRCFNNGTYNWFNRNQISGTFQRNIIKRGFYANIVGEYCVDNIFGGQTWRNKIGEDFYNNKTFNNFENNIINNGFDQNIIINSFYKNNIGDYFNNNTVTYEMYNNIIGNTFQYNTIMYYFSDNKIGNEFKGNVFYQSFSLNNVDSYIGGNNFSGYTAGNTIGPFTFDNDFFGDVVTNTWRGDFYSNTIGQGFLNNNFGISVTNNIIGESFQNNEIKSTFIYNTIGDNFGFGYGNYQGNKIGNNFSENIIGEYFYNNIIPDNFYYNTIGDYFQWNIVETYIDGIDFTIYYGNVKGFTYTALGNTGIDNVYIGLGGTTNGKGIDATFDIEISGGSVVGITGNSEGKLYICGDTITISGIDLGGVNNAVDTFSNNISSQTGIDGTYTNLTVTGGTGINATFDVTVASGIVSGVLLNDGGSYYSVSDTLTILGSLFGGTDGVDDIIITVTSIQSDNIQITVNNISPKPSVYEGYTSNIFKRSDYNNRLSYYDENDILTITDINV